MTPQELANQYVALWNERDEQARRERIEQLWVPDGEHYVGEQKVRGYSALVIRVVGSHDKYVRDGGNCFRAAPGAQSLQDGVTFKWEMVPEGGDDVVAAGLEFVLLDGSGKIVKDYMFAL